MVDASVWPSRIRGVVSAGREPRAPSNINAVSDVSTLVTRCRDGDAVAFRELFRLHRQEVARLVYRMTGATADLE